VDCPPACPPKWNADGSPLDAVAGRERGAGSANAEVGSMFSRTRAFSYFKKDKLLALNELSGLDT